MTQSEFIIKDNASFWGWDFDMLANEWGEDELNEWGLNIPWFDEDLDFSDKNKEINVNDFKNTWTIKLQYLPEQYEEMLELMANKKYKLWYEDNEKLMYNLLVGILHSLFSHFLRYSLNA